MTKTAPRLTGAQHFVLGLIRENRGGIHRMRRWPTQSIRALKKKGLIKFDLKEGRYVVVHQEEGRE